VGCGASLRVSSVHERGCDNWLAGSGGGDGAVRSREMLASAAVLEIDPTQVWVVDHPELQVRLQRSAGRMDTKCAGTSVGWATTRAAHVHSIVQDGMRAVWPAEVVRRLVTEKVTSTDARMVRVSSPANLREGTGRASRDGDMHSA